MDKPPTGGRGRVGDAPAPRRPISEFEGSSPRTAAIQIPMCVTHRLGYCYLIQSLRIRFVQWSSVSCMLRDPVTSSLFGLVQVFVCMSQ